MTDPGWLPWLERAARVWPHTIACEAGDGRVDFAGLRDHARRLAASMQAAGIRRGDRVAALMAPGTEFLALLHAAQIGGWALVPPNPRLRRDELRRLLDHAAPALLLHDAAHAAAADAAVGLCRIRDIRALPPAGPRPGDAVAADPEAVVALVCTSGTTGAPKAVELTSAAFEAGAAASLQRLGVAADDRWLAAMPMCHVGGLSIAVRAALAGMTIVQHDGFDAARVDRSLRHDGIAFVSLVPTMLARVLDAGGDTPYPASLKAVVLGGGRLPPALVARAARIGLPLVATYGMTETAAMVTTSLPGDAVRHPGSAGHPLDGVAVRIDAPGADGVGEIVVRGAQVCRGYFRDAARTARTLRDGWLHSGDLGRIDADGRLWVEVRRTDLIVTGGENVIPEEVEEVLAAHPDVAEAAVYGEADDEWGQQVVAAVVPRRDGAVEPEALRAWCRERLAGFKVPRRVRLAAELPRTASGKVIRALL